MEVYRATYRQVRVAQYSRKQQNAHGLTDTRNTGTNNTVLYSRLSNLFLLTVPVYSKFNYSYRGTLDGYEFKSKVLISESPPESLLKVCLIIVASYFDQYLPYLGLFL